jgi:hypothetical protein
MKPLEFNAVIAIRARHDEDVRTQNFRGRALLAHEDRAELLAIIEQLQRRMRAAAAAEAEVPAKKKGE